MFFVILIFFFIKLFFVTLMDTVKKQNFVLYLRLFLASIGLQYNIFFLVYLIKSNMFFFLIHYEYKYRFKSAQVELITSNRPLARLLLMFNFRKNH